MTQNQPGNSDRNGDMAAFRAELSRRDFGHDYLASAEHRLAWPLMAQGIAAATVAQIIAKQRHDRDARS